MPVHSVVAYTRDLDAPLTVTPLKHHLVSGDALGDRFDIALTRGGQPITLTGAGVQAYFIRSADGYTIPFTGSAEGSVATVTLPSACYTVPGRFTLTVKAAVGGVNHAVFVGEGAVLRSSTDALVDPSHTIPDVGELLAMIAQIESATTAAQNATTNANSAASKANSAASSADTARSSAEKATTAANSAAAVANKWGNVTVTVTTLAADQTATVTLTDTSTGKTLAFKLPRGLTGLTPNLKIGTVTTGSPGTNATATITGTAENPLLNLTIPRGDIGSIGNLTVNGIFPDGAGRIILNATDVGALPITGGTASGPIVAKYAGENNPFIRAAAEDRSVQLNVSSAGNIGIWGSVPGKSGWLARMESNGSVYMPGQADTAVKLATPRKINGVAFDGSDDITLPLTWRVGDRVTAIHSFPVTGLITSSKTAIHLNLNLGKPFDRDITKINIYSLIGGLRSVSGAYIDGTSDATNLLEKYDVKMFFGTYDGQVSIQIRKVSGFGNVLNNTPVALLVCGLDIGFAR